MTLAAACQQLVERVREVAALRRELAAMQLVATSLAAQMRSQHLEIERLKARYHALIAQRRADREAA